MSHRPPTTADIGKQVEVSRDGEQWQAGTLLLMSFGRRGQYFTIDMNQSTFEHCRVPYSCPDPIAELSEAADWLADKGCDEAARVLMREVEGRTATCSSCGKVCDIERMLRPFELITDDVCCSDECCEAMNDRYNT